MTSPPITAAEKRVAETLHRELELQLGFTTLADELVRQTAETLLGLRNLSEAVAAYERTVSPTGGQPPTPG